MPHEDERDAERTPLGRERMLNKHEERLDSLEDRVTKMEGKETSRDKRWDFAVKAISSIAIGIIIAVVSALIAGGAVHP